MKKRVEKSHHRKYTPIVLWWEDVTAIFEILSADCDKVEISTTEYVFGTLEAAKEHFGDTPQYEMKITSSQPWAVVEAERLMVGASEKAARIFMQVDTILSRRQRRFGWLYGNVGFFIVVMLGAVATVWPDGVLKLALFGVQGFFLLVYIPAAFISIKRQLVVYPWRRDQKRGFFGRNRDQLIMYILTTILGGVLTIGGLQIKERYFPSVATPPSQTPISR